MLIAAKHSSTIYVWYSFSSNMLHLVSQSENVRLEEAKLEGATEQERLSNELDQLRLISAKNNEGSQKCKSQ